MFVEEDLRLEKTADSAKQKIIQNYTGMFSVSP